LFPAYWLTGKNKFLLLPHESIYKPKLNQMSFKKITCSFAVLLFLATAASAQGHLPFNPGSNSGEVLLPWIAPAAGYSTSVDALRFSVITGNLFLTRVGGYVTIEKGTDSNFFTNIWGGTLTVTRHVYVWGGMDLFTNHGVINGFKGSRKEIGLGFKPWKGLLLNLGWSGHVGTTFSAGWSIPLSKE
jgi:hypothetical protein